MAGSEEDLGKQLEASAGTAGRTTFQRACAVPAETEARSPVLHEQVLILNDGRERFGVERCPANQRIVDFFFRLGRASDNPRAALGEKRLLLTSLL